VEETTGNGLRPQQQLNPTARLYAAAKHLFERGGIDEDVYTRVHY
jgi:hypothetical protein